jgi:hypothetical protein
MANLLFQRFKHGKNVSIGQDEINFYRHWDAQSEPYAGGDNLATALYLGWTLGSKVLLREHWCAGKRCVRVYYFELIYEEDILMMPVIANPFVECLITDSELQVMRFVNTFGIEESPKEVPSETRK